MDLPPTLSEPGKKVSTQNAVPEFEAKTPAATVKVLPGLVKKSMQPLTEKNAEQLKLPTQEIAINVDAMPLSHFIHMALGEILGLSFEVDASISTRQEPVTLHITHPVKARRLLGMVEQALRAYDIFLAWSPEGLRVLPITKASTTLPYVVSDRAKLLLNMGRAMAIIPLHYAEPSEALAFVRHFLQAGDLGDVTINTRLNALVVIGMPERIAAFQQAIGLVDNPNFANKKLTMIRPIYWQAKEMSQALRELLQAQDIPIAKNETDRGVRLIVIEPINAIVIASAEQSWIQLVNQWVEELDTAEAAGEESNSYVYFVKNATAKGLGAVLTSILGGDLASTETGTPTTSNATGNTTIEKAPISAVETNRSALTTDLSGKEQTEFGASAEGNGLRVVVDKERNALIFVGTARAYRTAYNLLQQLDKEPRQILIEATVADITLDDSTKLGVEWQFEHSDKSASHILGTLGGLKFVGGGLGYALTAGDISAKISALATEGKAKILSSPRLLTKDNEQATIQVGTQIAVINSEITSSQSVSNATNLARNFTYVDTGVILTFTPTILEDGKVELEVSQEVSEAGDSSTNTPPIFKRKVQTVLTAGSGQTILIGGLITHNEAVTVNKVPWLGDIPGLGYLFSTISRTDRATNMVILLTPHIVTSSADAVYLTKGFQDQLNWNFEDDKNNAVKEKAKRK